MLVNVVETTSVTEKSDICNFALENLKNSKKSFELEGGIVIISSKVISILEGNLVNLKEISFENLVEREADEVISCKNGVYLTLKNGIYIPNAGVDVSNTPKNTAITWPRDPWGTADSLKECLKKEFGLKNIGVIISDSFVVPGRKGVTGVALAWSGVEGVEDERSREDLFGEPLKITQKAIADNLVSSALLLMGEADESTPIAIIKDAPVKFTDRKIDPLEGIMGDGDLFDIG
jgi:coenzyme F420-0:L-glutamate ligase